MKDLIDLGNLVFNRLVEAHGEIEESRMMFLYYITKSDPWIFGTSRKTEKQVHITKDGVWKNFPDPVLDDLHKKWMALKLEVDMKFLEKRIAIMRAEFDRKAPKDGDVWEYGNSQGPFRELKF